MNVKTWFVQCEDGEIFSSDENSWKDVLNHTSVIKKLHLVNENHTIKMPDNCTGYNQSKTASCDFDGASLNIESHHLEALFNLTFQQCASGLIKLRVSICEKTGDIDITLEDAE